MMRNVRCFYLPALAGILFLVIAAGCKVAAIPPDYFDVAESAEQFSSNGSYIELIDGTKVTGSKLRMNDNAPARNMVGIDDQRFRIAGVRGYKDRNVYYARMGSSDEFIKRIVTGKINVYLREQLMVSRSTYGQNITAIRNLFYMQLGDGEPMVEITSHKMIVSAVNDCAEAVVMANKSVKEIRRAIKEDRHYINSIFETYNKCNTK